jgi:hypothetical protein
MSSHRRSLPCKNGGSSLPSGRSANRVRGPLLVRTRKFGLRHSSHPPRTRRELSLSTAPRRSRSGLVDAGFGPTSNRPTRFPERKPLRGRPPSPLCTLTNVQGRSHRKLPDNQQGHCEESLLIKSSCSDRTDARVPRVPTVSPLPGHPSKGYRSARGSINRQPSCKTLVRRNFLP